MSSFEVHRELSDALLNGEISATDVRIIEDERNLELGVFPAASGEFSIQSIVFERKKDQSILVTMKNPDGISIIEARIPSEILKMLFDVDMKVRVTVK